MEKSCESGMRCASALYEANGCKYDEQRLNPATLPLAFLRATWFRILSPIVAVALIATITWWFLRA
jgi:hypothetical protein